MSLVAFPRQVSVDADGQPRVGAQWGFYEAGTNTPITVYTTAAMTATQANPVISLSNGYFPAVYIDAGVYQTHKQVLLDADDLVLFTEDNIPTAAEARYPLTDAETDAGITPVDFGLPELTVERYGPNTVPGTTDMHLPFQKAIDVAYERGGGVVKFATAGNYRLTASSTTVLNTVACGIVKANVRVEASGATLLCECGTGSQTGIWLFGDKAWLDGAIVSVSSSGSPSSQGFFHTAVAIGVPNNSGDTVASPSVGQYMAGWGVTGCTLSTNLARRPALQFMGGVNNGLIFGNTFPTSTTHSAIHGDWGNLGTVSSSDITTTRASFNANSAFTTHPNNIKIIQNKVGLLSVAVSGDTGSFGARLSGCYEMEIDGLYIESTTYAAVLHTAGDLGFEFAPTAVKRMACKGTVIKNVNVLNASTSMLQGIFVDTLADNVYREQFLTSYAPLMNPLHHGDVVVERCQLMGANVDSTYGVRVIQGRGVKVRNCQAQKWKHGIFIDEFTQDIEVTDNDVTSNRNEGIQVGFAQLREGTERVLIARNKAYDDGTDSAGADIRVTRGKSIWLYDNIVGSPSTTQTTGIRVDDAACLRDIRLRGNHCIGATTAAFSVMGSTPANALLFKALTVAEGNTVADGVSPTSGFFSNPDYLPYSSMTLPVSRRLSRYYNPSTSAPTTGTWYRNETIDPMVCAAAGTPGHLVTTAGTFGTLASITNAATTNGSKDITCSLTGITVTMSQSAYSCVVSSATGIRAGMKCSIPGASITNAEIIAISGTTLQLDTQAAAAVSGGTFTTSGLIEGEVISINTTTPVASACVLKVNGTTVTLDAAPVDTQSGRTISYTAPVFKAFAAVAA